jgi:hypothetical protein
MPRGYKENSNYPELPAILNYLKEYSGKEFESAEVFQADILDGFLRYLDEQKVPQGTDPKLREGLEAKKLDKSFIPLSGGSWDYFVLTPAANGPGICVFGGLERLGV